MDLKTDFNQFIEKVNHFFHNMGQIAYVDLKITNPKKFQRNNFQKILFFCLMISMNLCAFGCIVNLFDVDGISGQKFIEISNSLLYFFIANLKITTILMTRKRLSKIMYTLENIYPNTKRLRKLYRVDLYIRKYHKILNIQWVFYVFTAIFLVAIRIYWNLNSLIRNGAWLYLTIMASWYPFDYKTLWKFPLVFIQETIAIYCTATILVSVDLFLISLVSQLCMHFDYVSRKLKILEPSMPYTNIIELKRIIVFHNTIIK